MITRHDFVFRSAPAAAVALLLARTALAAPEKAQPADLLKKLNPAHPRLLWTKSAQAETLNAHGKNPTWQRLQKITLALADAILAEPPARYEIPDGRRLLGQSRAALRRILFCAYAWRTTGAAKYRERALVEMRTVCAFKDWNPSHFLDVAEMSLAVAVGYDWLYETLTTEERTFFSTSLNKLALQPGLRAYKNKSFWVGCDHNWNQVCNAGLVAAAFAIAEDEPALSADIFSRALASLPRAMRQYNPDGGYQEGPGYWEYGTTFNVVFIELLRSALGTDAGLLSDEYPGFKKTAAYFRQMRGTSGQYFNYADSGTHVAPSPAFAYLAQHSPFATSELLADSRDELEKYLNTLQKKLRPTDRFFPMFSIWFASGNSPASVSSAPLPTRFRGPAEVAVLRAPQSPANAFAGLKTGRNGVNHGHLDLGSFVYDAYGIRWASDLGGDNYNLPGYWGTNGPRWKIFRLNNRSHNTLTPGNALQKANALASIRVQSGAESQFAIAALSDVYPAALSTWNRGLRLDPETGILLVQDEVVTKAPGTMLEWKLFTHAGVGLARSGHYAALEHDGKAVCLRIVSPENFVFKIKSADPDLKGQSMNAGITQLVAEGLFAETSGTLAVQLIPVADSPLHFEDPKYNVHLTPLAKWK
ncbi:MAG: heparinase II/III-family protein [Puniceicoccales bacterium]|jgi:hypothetical protein|nr:heparinase II/III-family protein [Puniceicoccales bacterium]